MNIEYRDVPYSMPFSEQKKRWFTILLFIALPFYVLFRFFQGKLPPLSQVGPPKPKT